MGINVPSSEYEAEANRLRAQIGGKIDVLKTRLTPSALGSEAAASVGIADLSWPGAFDYASRRHPLAIAIVGAGVALLAIAAARNAAARRNVGALTTSLRTTSDSLVDSATGVLRARAEENRRAFVDAAQTQVAAGAAKISDEIEKRLGTVVDRVPGGANVRPLIESSLQVALAALLEGLLQGRSRAR